MKTTFLGTLFASAMLLVSANAELNIGAAVPNLTMTDYTGTEHTLEGFKGKTVVLEWTNFECPFVRKHYDSNNMQTLQEKYNTDDVVWLGVISSAEGKQGHLTAETAPKVLAENSFAGDTLILDPAGALGKAFNAQTTPHMFVINPEGVLVYQGAIDSIASWKVADVPQAENYVASALNAMAEGETIASASTKPYGCSVKY